MVALALPLALAFALLLRRPRDALLMLRHWFLRALAAWQDLSQIDTKTCSFDHCFGLPKLILLVVGWGTAVPCSARLPEI